jgi:hypothetical protein
MNTDKHRCFFHAGASSFMVDLSFQSTISVTFEEERRHSQGAILVYKEGASERHMIIQRLRNGWSAVKLK